MGSYTAFIVPFGNTAVTDAFCTIILLVSLNQSTAWRALDCDQDGVTNGQELTDGTDPKDTCSYNSVNQVIVNVGFMMLSVMACVHSKAMLRVAVHLLRPAHSFLPVVLSPLWGRWSRRACVAIIVLAMQMVQH